MKIAVLLLIASFSVTSAQAATSVFGFELGQPIGVSECPFKPEKYPLPGKIASKYYDPLPPETCFEEAHQINTYGQAVRRIIFGRGESPVIVKNWNMIALERDGQLIGVHFFTTGVASQDVVFNELVKKFGKPNEQHANESKNAMGATFQALHASWDSAELVVRFDGITDRLDRGEVTIDLPEAFALRKSWDASTPSQRKL